MPGRAYDVMAEFWRRQDSRDYTRLVDLFADDATIVDPIYGVFEGKAAIQRFMDMMVTEMSKGGIEFDLVELAGDDETAWAQWIARTPRGETHGCGLYRVKNGAIAYYRDYMNARRENA